MAALENVRPSQLLDRNLLAKLGNNLTPFEQVLPDADLDHGLVPVENLTADASSSKLLG